MRRAFIGILFVLAALGVFCVPAALGQQAGGITDTRASKSATVSKTPDEKASTGRASSLSTHAGAQPSIAAAGSSRGPSSESTVSVVQDKEAQLVEGEKRFATNCGRCHQMPHKFPPRMIATVERHMRVRATITDEDMRLIMRYLTQ
jgi:mono/diheme cytochrome c family protein